VERRKPQEVILQQVMLVPEMLPLRPAAVARLEGQVAQVDSSPLERKPRQEQAGEGLQASGCPHDDDGGRPMPLPGPQAKFPPERTPPQRR